MKKMKVLYSDSKDSINMSKERFVNLFLIDIIVGDKTIPLIFDTGGSITAISKSVADSIGAVILPDSVKVGGNTGNTLEVSKRIMPTFIIGNNTIENSTVIVAPDKQFDFGLDEKGNSLKIYGVLGWDIISKFKWTIEPHTRSFSIEQPKLSESKELLYWDNMPIINVQHNNQNMYFGFDSGNTETMFSKNFIPFIKTKQEKIDDIAGVGGRVEENVYLVDKIKLRISNKDIELNNISALKRDIFPTKEFKIMGLLAADIIQNHKCIIDFTNHDFQLD